MATIYTENPLSPLQIYFVIKLVIDVSSPPSNVLFVITQILGATWPAATRVLSRGRERTLGTRLALSMEGTDVTFTERKWVERVVWSSVIGWLYLISTSGVMNARLVLSSRPDPCNISFRITVCFRWNYLHSLCKNLQEAFTLNYLRKVWKWAPLRQRLCQKPCVAIMPIIHWYSFQYIVSLGKRGAW